MRTSTYLLSTLVLLPLLGCGGGSDLHPVAIPSLDPPAPFMEDSPESIRHGAQAYPAPDITGLEVNPYVPACDVLGLRAGCQATLTPLGTNLLGGWSWSFGTGTTPNTSIAKSPTVVAKVPGDYSGSVTARQTYFTGPTTPPVVRTDTYAFRYAVEPMFSSARTVDQRGPNGAFSSIVIMTDGTYAIAYDHGLSPR